MIDSPPRPRLRSASALERPKIAILALVLLAHPLAVRLLAGLYPLLMLFTVVVSANHYLLDAVGGALAVALATVVALILEPGHARLRRVRLAARPFQGSVVMTSPPVLLPWGDSDPTYQAGWAVSPASLPAHRRRRSHSAGGRPGADRKIHSGVVGNQRGGTGKANDTTEE